MVSYRLSDKFSNLGLHRQIRVDEQVEAALHLLDPSFDLRRNVHFVSNFSDFLLVPHVLATFVLAAQIVFNLFHPYAGRRFES